MLVATAGHVDHGKTSLVRQLTGIDTDRLAEEKRRGLTIELGFAFRDTPSGEPVGFIDVPGHHRFINTMIAGVNGIDLGMLVVAADDGPMPQTLEHLEILQLLGVERFVGVISKIDLVGKERLVQVEDQLAELVPQCPQCQVSSKTGEGIEQLQALLNEQSKNRPQSHSETLFRLYIDRAFSKKGAGLVVTGTCLAGSVTTGDTLYLHSISKAGSIPVRVREVHSQGQAATGGQAGQRCALNIAGKVSIEQLQRGGFLCANPSALPSPRLDTRCWTLSGAKHSLKHLGRVKLHIGSRRVGAATYLLNRELSADMGRQKRDDPVQSDQRIQLILDKDVVAFSGDRFVLRSDDERTTLCGGIVIDPVAPQRGKSQPRRRQRLDALESKQPAGALQQLLFEQQDTVSLQWLRRIWNLSTSEMENLLSRCDIQKIVRIRQESDELIVSRERWARFADVLNQTLADWHRMHPMEHGMDPSLLQSRLLTEIPKPLIRAVLDDQVRSGQVFHKDQLVHALGHRPTLSHLVQREWQSLETLLRRHGLQMPLRSEIMRESGVGSEQLERLVRPAVKRGELFEVGEKRLALPVTIVECAELVRRHCKKNSSISVIEAKRVFGLGRGLTIEILEFLDSIGYTRRRGNAREIVDPLAAERLLH